MQKVLIGFLAVTTAALCVLCGVQWQQLQAARERARVEAQARAAEADAREAQSVRLKELERNEARLEKQVQQFSKLTTTLRANSFSGGMRFNFASSNSQYSISNASCLGKP